MKLVYVTGNLNKEKISKYINPYSIKVLEDVCKLVDPVNLCSYREILCK